MPTVVRVLEVDDRVHNGIDLHWKSTAAVVSIMSVHMMW